MPGHGDDKERVEEEVEETLAIIKELKLTEFSLPEEERRNKLALQNPMILAEDQKYPQVVA